MAISVQDCDLMKQIQAAYDTDLRIKELIEALKKKTDYKRHFTWKQDTLRRKSKLVIPAVPQLRSTILDWLHRSCSGGHSG